MELIAQVEKALWDMLPTRSYSAAHQYIEKWQRDYGDEWHRELNFTIHEVDHHIDVVPVALRPHRFTAPSQRAFMLRLGPGAHFIFFLVVFAFHFTRISDSRNVAPDIMDPENCKPDTIEEYYDDNYSKHC